MKKGSAEERKLLHKARKRFESACTAEAKNRSAALDDLRFFAGDQWSEYDRAQRMNQCRPCLTINKIPTFVHQITNDQRQNRPAISVSPIGDRGDKKTAEMLRGLIREIERHSDSDCAYDSGYFNAVTNGFGYWRVVTEFESEDSFDQVIRVLRVRNPFTVYLDKDRQQPDGSDAMWAFVTEMMPREEYERTWPKASIRAWDLGGIGEDYRNWCDEKTIRIAEYFTVDVEMKDLVYLANGHVGFREDLDEKLQKQIADDPNFVLKERKSERRKITWRKITAWEILEEQDWPGNWIPIIQVIGDEVDIEGKVTLSGITRGAKDPQRMVNFWQTAFTERVALETKAPWLMAEGQIEGHEKEWRNANTEARSVITYKVSDVNGKLVPPPMRQAWGGAPMGVLEGIQLAEQGMMATTGIRFDATKSERIQDESGIALQQLRNNQQLGSFHYIDNQARSLKHTGRVIIDLVPYIYDTKRVLTILREDGGDERVQIDPNQSEPFKEYKGNGQTVRSFNPNVGKYEVAVTIGPNYETRRQEAADSMIQFGKAYPAATQYIMDLVAKNQQWPGSDEIAKRLAMLLPPQMLQPEQKDITPQMQAFIAAMQKQLQQLTQERDQALKLYQDKAADRALDKEKIDRDFEAKVLAIQEKGQANLLTHLRAIVDEIKNEQKEQRGFVQ